MARRAPNAPSKTKQQSAEWAKHLAKMIDQRPGGIVLQVCREDFQNDSELEIEEMSQYRAIVREAYDLTLERITTLRVEPLFFMDDKGKIQRGPAPKAYRNEDLISPDEMERLMVIAHEMAHRNAQMMGSLYRP